MSKIQNRGSAVVFGGAGGGGEGNVSIVGPPVNVNSVSRFATTDGKNIKGSGNQLTFDGTLFAVRDGSDNLLFGVDVVSGEMRFDLGEANQVDVTYDEPHLNFGFAGVDAAISLSHTDADQDLFFEVFESGQPAAVDNSSLQMGWDETRGSFVFQAVKNGTGVLRGIDMLAPSVTVNTPAPEASAVFEASSTTQGILAPRLTTVQRDAVSAPAAGLLIYNTTTSEYNFFDGSVWKSISAAGGSDTITIFFGESGNLATGAFMKIGEVLCSNSNSWLAPFDYDLKKISISRTDSDASDIEVIVAGVVEHTIATAANGVTAVLTASVLEGERVCLRNKTTGNTMTNVIVTLILERV